MISPDYVGVHQLRVGKMIIFSQHLLSVSFPEFNFRRGDFIGRHHDVPEGISPLGDIPTNLKKALSPESCKLLDTIERKCIEILSEHLLCSEYYEEPETVHGLLTEALEKTTLESQVMKWFDLVDAYMVTMREIERGNGAEFFPIYERYLRIMRNIAQAQQYPEITHILSSLKFPEWESYHESLFDEEFEE